jgi:hypothetical protein
MAWFISPHLAVQMPVENALQVGPQTSAPTKMLKHASYGRPPLLSVPFCLVVPYRSLGVCWRPLHPHCVVPVATTQAFASSDTPRLVCVVDDAEAYASPTSSIWLERYDLPRTLQIE